MAELAETDLIGEIVYGDVRKICGFKHAMFLPDGDNAYVVLDKYYFSPSSPLNLIQQRLIFFHELAHLFLKHHLVFGASQRSQEVDADLVSGFFMGFRFGANGVNPSEIKNMRKTIQEDMYDLYKDQGQSSNYLSPKARIHKIVEGFDLGIRVSQTNASFKSTLESFATYTPDDKIKWELIYQKMYEKDEREGAWDN